MSQKYKKINVELLKVAESAAWSIENMEAHGAEGRNVEYVGSHAKGNIIYDYYQDNTGAWWFGNRGIIDGCIVSMDVLIFGRSIKKGRGKR